MMRRLRVVPFEHSPDEVDRLLGEKLKAEWPGILQWAVEGCLMWLKEGLTPPEAIQLRTAEYRREENPVETFIQETCELGPDLTVTRQDLYNAWALWCHRQGEDAGTMKQLKRRFHSAELAYGLSDARLEGQRGYRGIALQEELP
jgi:putative DNA primase/helicase